MRVPTFGAWVAQDALDKSDLADFVDSLQACEACEVAIISRTIQTPIIEIV